MAELHAPTRVLLVVAAALVDTDGRVLVAQRPQGKALAGLWEFRAARSTRASGLSRRSRANSPRSLA